MNRLDKQYTDLLQTILDYGVEKKDRTGTGTKSIFGYTIRHKMSDGFPLLTTKKMYFKGVVTELLWFLRGDTNIKYLVDNDCHIWDGDAYQSYLKFFDSLKYINSVPLSKEEFINKIKIDDEFAKEWGDLGPIYGKQWRDWNDNGLDNYLKGIDQISNLINDLKTNPDSRRLMVNAWNVGEIYSMVLPPCHYGFQVYTSELSSGERRDWVIKNRSQQMPKFFDRLGWEGNVAEVLENFNAPTRAISLMWNQRSVDTFLGLPFNIASYGLLLEIIAKEVNMVPDELIGNLGDVHLYLNHIEQVKEQIGRKYTPEERQEMLKTAMGDEHYQIEIDNQMPFGGGMSEHYNFYKIPYRTKEPYPLPTITLPSSLQVNSGNWDKLVFEDFYLNNYQSHPPIKAPLSN